MASNEFRAARKKIRRATVESEVKAAVELLDQQWREHPEVMRDVHWPIMSRTVGRKVRRIRAERKP